MAHDVIPLGAVPSGESAAQVGESGYAEVAFLQCTRYIALLRHTVGPEPAGARLRIRRAEADVDRSEEHTSELQSLAYLVCRLLLEKKKVKRRGHGRAELS